MKRQLRGWTAIFLKDLRLVARNKTLLVVLVIYPFLMMGIIGAAFSQTGNPTPLGVVNLDTSGDTIFLGGERVSPTQLFTQVSGEGVSVHEYTTTAEAIEVLRKGKIDAVVEIPPGFISDLEILDSVATIPVILDESNAVKASLADTAVRGAFSRINEEVVATKVSAVTAGLLVLVDGGNFFGSNVLGLRTVLADLTLAREALAGQPELAARLERDTSLASTVVRNIGDAATFLRGTAQPIALQVTGISGRSITLKESVIPALIALSILWTGILAGAILMAMEAESGIYRRLRLSRLGSVAVLFSKMLLSSAIILLQALIMLAIAIIFFGFSASHLALGILVILLACLSSIGIGLLIASYAREVSSTITLALLVSFPLVFLCGAIFPLSEMPGFMQGVAHAVPLTYALDAMSGALLRGDSFVRLLPDLGILLAFGLGLAFAGALLFKRRERWV